jgi:hypothetical protein
MFFDLDPKLVFWELNTFKSTVFIFMKNLGIGTNDSF